MIPRKNNFSNYKVRNKRIIIMAQQGLMRHSQIFRNNAAIMRINEKQTNKILMIYP